MAKFISGVDASNSAITHKINQESVIKVIANSADQAVILYSDGGAFIDEVTITNSLTEVLAMVDNLVSLEVFSDDAKTETVTTLLKVEAFVSLFSDSTDSMAKYNFFKSNYTFPKIDLTVAQLETLLETSGYKILSTAAASAIAATTATLNGSAFGYALSEISAMGFAYAETETPVIADDSVELASPVMGVFTANVTGLTTATLYYVRAYITVDGSTVYGDQVSFTTS